MATAVKVAKAEIVLENPADNLNVLIKAGAFADTTGATPVAPGTFIGVFDVTFTPTLAGTSFKILLGLNGLDVDSTAAYRAKPLVVLPAPLTSAPHSNYTILTEPGQRIACVAPCVYVDEVASTSYAYIAGDKFRVLIDARDQFSNLRYDSTTDQFEVKLTS